MISKTHSHQSPCVDYEDAVKLKKLGFDEYTRASYIGKSNPSKDPKKKNLTFTDWMGWRNSRKLTDPKHGLLGDDGELKKGVNTHWISAPTLIQAARWLKIDLSINEDWAKIEYQIKINLNNL